MGNVSLSCITDLLSAESINSRWFFLFLTFVLTSLLLIAVALWLKSCKKIKKLTRQHRISVAQFCEEHRLTPRECEILTLLLRGRTLSQIEEKIFISRNTIRNHVYHIYKKLGVTNRVDLVNTVREGILPERENGFQNRP